MMHSLRTSVLLEHLLVIWMMEASVFSPWHKQSQKHRNNSVSLWGLTKVPRNTAGVLSLSQMISLQNQLRWLLVGAALIKKYSSYRTKQKKFHVFFPQNRSLGTWNNSPTSGRRFSPPGQFCRSPSLLTLPKIDPPWHWMRVIVTSCLRF